MNTTKRFQLWAPGMLREPVGGAYLVRAVIGWTRDRGVTLASMSDVAWMKEDQNQVPRGGEWDRFRKGDIFPTLYKEVSDQEIPVLCWEGERLCVRMRSLSETNWSACYILAVQKAF